tara:strand:- start:5768 stop:6541 length:774 start_codon:yes stop_codon:yes gene_type:complete
MISGIIGHPLKNPRSIPIWKNFFQKNSISSEMIKWDVPSSDFNEFISDLLINQDFLATAITMPYKKLALNYADSMDISAKSSNSTNLLIKDRKKIIAYNTDVIGAENTLKKIISYYDKILIIGFGGSGEAIYRYFKDIYKNKTLNVVSSKNIKDKNFITKLTKEHILKKSILINCTPLGSDLSDGYIQEFPFNEELLNFVNPETLIFDIIYSPDKTKLFYECKKRNIKYINGLNMNTHQANLALNLVQKAYLRNEKI